MAPPTLRNNSQRQFEHSKLNANLGKFSSLKLLNSILRYCTQIVLDYVLFYFVEMVGPPKIYIKLIAKANLNIAVEMQTFENFILQNCSTEFYDIAHTWSLGMCNYSLFK